MSDCNEPNLLLWEESSFPRGLKTRVTIELEDLCSYLSSSVVLAND